MRRLRALLAAPILAAALAGTAPAVTLACSCMPPPTLAELVKESPEMVLVAGRVGFDRGDGSFEFAVERWFNGPNPRGAVIVQSAEERAPDGTTMYNSCGLGLSTGTAMFLSAATEPDGRIVPSSCLPHGLIDDEGGRALVAEAERAFGPGFPPDDPGDSTEPPSTPGSGGASIDPFVVAALGLTLVAGLGIFGLVALIGRRRPNAG